MCSKSLLFIVCNRFTPSLEEFGTNMASDVKIAFVIPGHLFGLLGGNLHTNHGQPAPSTTVSPTSDSIKMEKLYETPSKMAMGRKRC